MKKRKIIAIHFLIFLVLTVTLFFGSENLLKKVAPEFNNVMFWIDLILFGTIAIFILTVISSILFIKYKK
ncbi:hypothetical protein GOQ30_12420 [Flavobacterium sp. TP390]|uniref:Uncharacterized protein n=1 Tax=Flavobacterium profundi TaxID=1774945 RepID=A0A6I4ISY1_9FLAO|nr:hypothetical protein [Flavobacterium profundi]MVO09967.1 hypothetical protein [Flavobacterium profundi]